MPKDNPQDLPLTSLEKKTGGHNKAPDELAELVAKDFLSTRNITQTAKKFQLHRDTARRIVLEAYGQNKICADGCLAGELEKIAAGFLQEWKRRHEGTPVSRTWRLPPESSWKKATLSGSTPNPERADSPTRKHSGGGRDRDLKGMKGSSKLVPQSTRRAANHRSLIGVYTSLQKSLESSRT